MTEYNQTIHFQSINRLDFIFTQIDILPMHHQVLLHNKSNNAPGVKTLLTGTEEMPTFEMRKCQSQINKRKKR